jgi:hypothetical protein
MNYFPENKGTHTRSPNAICKFSGNQLYLSNGFHCFSVFSIMEKIDFTSKVKPSRSTVYDKVCTMSLHLIFVLYFEYSNFHL